MACTVQKTDRKYTHCVFLCFYSAIFKVNECEVSYFCLQRGNLADEDLAVRSSCMKFGQQFEINKLYVCTKFRGNESCGFGLRTRKPPQKFGVKSGLIRKWPFPPYQPTFGRDDFFSFFFLNLVRSSSPKPQSIEI